MDVIKPSAIEVLMKAYQESNGKYVDIVVEHGELAGITVEHLKLWDTYINETVYYRMWHPKDHISHSVKTVTEGNGKIITYMYAEEKIGDYGPCVMCLRKEPPESAPVKQVYQPLATNTNLGPNGEVLGGTYHEFQPTAKGMIMRSTFRLPAKTPKEYIEALRNHSFEEMGNFPKILPDLYTKTIRAERD